MTRFKNGLALCLIFSLLVYSCLNIYNFYSYPLISAAGRGQADEVEHLLKEEKNINARNFLFGQTALTEAVRSGHRDIALLLLDKGADINEKDGQGVTALMHAVEMEHRDMVEFLLNKGANINEKDQVGQTALMLAVKGAKKDSPEEKEYINIAWLLLDRGADIDEKDNLGQTALMIASKEGQTNIVRALQAAQKKPRKK